MFSLTLVWIFVVTVGVVWYMTKKKEKRGQKEIPGPKGLPLIGNIHQLGKFMHLKFNEWSEEFGDIYKVKMATQQAVVISNPKMVKEMFFNDAFAGRPHFDGFDIYEEHQLGIVNSEGELWEVHRRFLLRQLRDFGFGKSAMENLILEELNEVIKRFQATEGKPTGSMKETLSLAVINALWSVVSCQRFQHDDPQLMKLVNNTSKAVQDIFEKGGLIAFIPWLRHIMPEMSGYKGFRETMDENRKWFEEIVEEHKKTYQEDNLRDFIDVYLAEVKKTTDSNSVFYGSMAEKQLVATIADLFFAGTDTTSTTLSWAVLYLCKIPQVQKKFQEEIGTVTGNSRLVSVADRPTMPYTLALIDEVLRYSSIVPNGVQHRATTGKEFQGYYIPKDTWIMPNMHYMHHNPKVWGDPTNFRPERFLSEDGKTYKKSENLLAFQIGRRQCVGETLARDTVFLFLTNIFQKFDISFDPNSPEPSMTETAPNFLLNPQPFSVIMKSRF
ncbi:Methyl farnesoate epoxidase [Orchesella cincta]|uniref:Methyl farnesoate epoxidase n=1 Tax=Orchesella cincta TaxID=48709 RepID=A0A1D2M6X8_ORCCI|nr:Methyl farnesoate epoxidase [Orchesella cincta]